jgi:hypothetical protein
MLWLVKHKTERKVEERLEASVFNADLNVQDWTWWNWVAQTSLGCTNLVGKLQSVVHSYFVGLHFFRITQYNADAHNMYILTPMNTRTQTLPLWALLKDWAGGSRDSWSHHWRFAVDGDVAYHWKHSAWNKSRKIRALVPSRRLGKEKRVGMVMQILAMFRWQFFFEKTL